MVNPQSPDVPIFVETASRAYFPMVRCSYISIECDDPRPGWQIGLGNGFASFLLLELVGIVQQPLGAVRFSSKTLIDRLFEQVEEQEFLLINFADIWLPQFLFASPPGVGDVYRVANGLFAEAFRFRDGQQDQQHFEERCKGQPPLAISADETRAFAAWTDEQISTAQTRPPKDPRLRLPTRTPE
jgi:hypothetical protein